MGKVRKEDGEIFLRVIEGAPSCSEASLTCDPKQRTRRMAMMVQREPIQGSSLSSVLVSTHEIDSSSLLLCLVVGCDPTESENGLPDTAAEIDSEIGTEEDVAGANDAPVGDLSPFERVQADVLIPYCANGGCHGGTPGMGNGMLVLDGSDSHGALVGVEPFNASAREAGMLLVEPGNLENSFLWQKNGSGRLRCIIRTLCLPLHLSRCRMRHSFKCRIG